MGGCDVCGVCVGGGDVCGGEMMCVLSNYASCASSYKPS